MIHPIPHEMLVRYWAADVSDDETDAIEEHLFGCATCFDASSRFAALRQALTQAIPPVATARDIAFAEARGVRKATNDIEANVATETWLHAGTHLLVHRLLGDLEDVTKVSVAITLPDGSPLLSFADVPFDASAGAVLIACQRHFVEQFPPDVHIVVSRTHRAGRESIATYTVLHRIG